ncbi:hypothetical protein FB451DRAFT_1413411 [Mycena latifolia]|nr:hypothetical protein FB451DRAFT_1413411 [Mycena latifolia]
MFPTSEQGFWKIISRYLRGSLADLSQDLPGYPGWTGLKRPTKLGVYSAAHEKMSLLGIEKNTLTHCTEILPQSIDLKNLAVGSSSGKAPTDPGKLEAAIQKYRSIWL